MELLYLGLGGFLSWIITHVYYRLSSKYPPEWAKPLVNNLPEEQPSNKEEFTKIIENSWDEISHKDLISESGGNSDGEWIKYMNGEQLCKGSFTLKKDIKDEVIKIDFPSSFSNPPSVDLTGPISNIQSKDTTENLLTVKLKPNSIEEPLKFKYYARGQWT